MSKIIELVRLYAESYKNGWGTLHDVRSEVSRMEAELAECKAKLAALEVQSPVGEISAIRKNHVACVAWFRKPGAARTKFYLAAGAREPAQPMTDGEIDLVRLSCLGENGQGLPQSTDSEYVNWHKDTHVRAFARAVEAHRGITGTKA